jgi:hypothetical protein
MRGFFRVVFWSAAIALLAGAAFGTAGVVLTRGWADATECEPKSKCETLPFDSTLWKAYGDWNNPVRLQMIDDLSASFGLREKPVEWIDEQLGTPEATHPFPGRCDYVYWLGPARSLVATEFEWLCLNFADGIVVDASIQYSGRLAPQAATSSPAVSFKSL